MPNGGYVLNDLKFNNEIRAMSDRDLMEFTAKLSYGNAIRISSLESRGKKTIGAIGGASALLGATIVAVLDYITRR